MPKNKSKVKLPDVVVEVNGGTATIERGPRRLCCVVVDMDAFDMDPLDTWAQMGPRTRLWFRRAYPATYEKHIKPNE